MFRLLLALSVGLVACDGRSPDPTSEPPLPEDEPELRAGGMSYLPDTAPIACAKLPVAAFPDPGLDWSTAAELCESGQLGQPWTQGVPPDAADWNQLTTRNAYGDTVHDFLWNYKYRSTDAEGQPGLGWMHDPNWRLAGPYVGCPDETGDDPAQNNGAYKGTHAWVRVWYSPEVIQWMCRTRQAGQDLNAATLPPGAAILKEMHSPVVGDLRVREGTMSTLWVDADYTDGISWAYMIKGQDNSADGWFWGYLGEQPTGDDVQYNLPILDKSGFITRPFPEPGNAAWAQLVDERGVGWLPTFNNNHDVAYLDEGFGNYCVRCHASAETELTFSAFANLLGQEAGYSVIAKGPNPPVNTDEHIEEEESPLCAHPASGNTPALGCFPQALPDGQPQAGFEETFPQFAGTRMADVWADRFPAQTWDHTVAAAGEAQPFLTSDQCIGCHDSTPAYNMTINVEGKDDTPVRLSLTPYQEWSASPMGLAGRDPIFFAQLESERNRALKEPGLKDKVDCVQNLCLHCHGVMGQRQHLLDTRDTPSIDACAGVLPADPANLMEQTFGGALFTRDKVAAWPGEDPDNARYAGLARDGISCAVCHHVAEEGLGEASTFTGNFHLGPADELFGPFEEVKTHPMEQALAIKPVYSEALTRSEMCGSCHAILLPVFDNQGNLRPQSEQHPEGSYSYEQATYLEWKNSIFDADSPSGSAETARSCQDCHMSHEFVAPDGTPEALDFRIANVQDATYPESEHSVQDELDLDEREGYRRHTLYGLNLFVNAMFQQFPLLLGYRQLSAMDSRSLPALLNAQDEAIKFARTETATVSLGALKREGDTLSVDVTVQNLGGHNLPSGVGFRRLFVEFVVLGEDGSVLWASGRTNDLGIILNGTTDEPLPTEFLEHNGEATWQPHHTTITDGSQVQIYEELNQDSAGVFTTSFIHRYEDVKDNRLRPQGWRQDGPYAEFIKPHGVGDDPDYTAAQLTGADTTTYTVTLPAGAKVGRVTARLYAQATPPYFLQQRFDGGLEGPHSTDSRRLYYIAAHLNTEATTNFETRAGDLAGPYIDDWRLLVAEATATP
ncbi:MAG: hypothetical protein H6739_37050 [Alphaproteobacteria bacterium]|nr:hypothetical protein [Alphaproteobacteria bacterium]